MFYSLWDNENKHYIDGYRDFTDKMTVIHRGVFYLMCEVFCYKIFTDKLSSILKKTDTELEEMLRENNLEIVEHEEKL